MKFNKKSINFDGPGHFASDVQTYAFSTGTSPKSCRGCGAKNAASRGDRAWIREGSDSA